MSVDVKGMDALLADIENRLGSQRMEQISDEALIAASLIFKKELESQLKTFSGVSGTSGATVDELELTEPYMVAGVRTITARWRGPRNRYRIIHLNEFGTVNNPNPKGKGAIARALRNAESAYKNAIENVLRGAF